MHSLLVQEFGELLNAVADATVDLHQPHGHCHVILVLCSFKGCRATEAQPSCGFRQVESSADHLCFDLLLSL